MKKTTTYARKRAHRGAVQGAAAIIETLVRSKPMGESLEFVGMVIDATPEGSEYKKRVRETLERLRVGQGTTRDFDDIAHEIAIVGIRGSVLGGSDQAKADLEQIYTASVKAMEACRKRFLRWEKMELLNAEFLAIEDAINAWEVIFDASSPKQMNEASAAYVRWSRSMSAA